MTDATEDEALSESELVAALLSRMESRVEEEHEYLTELDSKIGDADFGTNLDRGVNAAVEALDDVDLEGQSAADVVRTIGETLIDEMAGSSGILFGGGLLTAADSLEGGLTPENVYEFADAYATHVEERGDVDVGAKTMYDAVVPATFLLKKSVANDESPAQITAGAAAAAKRGAAFTSTLEAKKGRASYVETRSIGHPDPGAVFTYIALEEIHEFIQERTGESVDIGLNDGL